VKRELPPLGLLLTFDAAARAGSFKEAARELCLTPSAVSQQIRALEEHLSIELFERTARGVQLNAAGRDYAAAVAAALDMLGSATRRLPRPGERQRIRISVDPFFGANILIPLLPQLQRAHPELDVAVESSQTIVDLRAHACDAALRFGRGSWPGLEAEQVAKVASSPVAAPELLATAPLRAVEDLANHTLISVQNVPDYWALVAQAAGFTIGKRLVFSTYEETLHAARHGMGVAMALLPLMQPWLDRHGLVAPLPVRWESTHFYLVYRPEDRALRGLRVLYESLREAFSAHGTCP
jgi:LysR family glycine cleavage system transcriptional activator